ncbi:MAG: hypothetical protein ACRD01_05595 [Terriglobales bacterium]
MDADGFTAGQRALAAFGLALGLIAAAVLTHGRWSPLLTSLGLGFGLFGLLAGFGARQMRSRTLPVGATLTLKRGEITCISWLPSGALVIPGADRARRIIIPARVGNDGDLRAAIQAMGIPVTPLGGSRRLAPQTLPAALRRGASEGLAAWLAAIALRRRGIWNTAHEVEEFASIMAVVIAIACLRWWRKERKLQSAAPPPARALPTER